jgi:hypothetical protein
MLDFVSCLPCFGSVGFMYLSSLGGLSSLRGLSSLGCMFRLKLLYAIPDIACYFGKLSMGSLILLRIGGP